jgi:PQQ-dependent dehydrogenase (methanol/ethanol family)
MGAGFLGPHNQGVSTWPGDEWKRGGGTTWGWYSYDPKLNLFYYSTGNPGSWNPTIRPGDNKWSMTIFARNPDTGQARWAYQMTPHDQWDYDGINENILVSLPVNGVMTPALVHFDRNGYAYVLDRRDGKLLAAHPYDPSNNTITRIDMATGRPVYNPAYETREGHNTTGLCPASIGAKDEAPASWDPQTHLFYVPTNHACEDYQPIPLHYVPGYTYVGAILRMYPGPGGYLGAFIGYDPLTGRYQFRDKEPFAAWGGAVTTAGGLAFYGTMPLRYHRERDDLPRARRQAVRGRAERCGRMGRYRPGGQPDAAHGRSGRRQRLLLPQRLHDTWRDADGVLAVAGCLLALSPIPGAPLGRAAPGICFSTGRVRAYGTRCATGWTQDPI